MEIFLLRTSFQVCRKTSPVHKWCCLFFEIIDPSLPLVTHFTKYSYGVTSPFGRSPLPPKWVMSFIDGPLVNILKLYLSPEFCLDSKILRPCPIFSNSMASSDWWMMTDLFSNISKTFIFSDTFISFTWIKIIFFSRQKLLLHP